MPGTKRIVGVHGGSGWIPKAKPVPAKKHARGGGAWRAFVSERCKGVCKAIFRTLAGEYRQLSAEDKQRYAFRGALGTLAHRSSGSSFGLVARALGRAMTKDTQNRRAAVFDRGGEAASDKSLALALRAQEFFVEVKKAQMDAIVFRRIEQSAVESAATELRSWWGSHGVK